MFRIRVSVAAAVVLSLAISAASAQTPAPAASPPKASTLKVTAEKLREMRAKWSANRPKLKACRAEARKKGLAGDDRWLFIEDCMGKA